MDAHQGIDLLHILQEVRSTCKPRNQFTTSLTLCELERQVEELTYELPVANRKLGQSPADLKAMQEHGIQAAKLSTAVDAETRGENP